MSKIVKM